jgi:FkbM family methyltransferase
MEPLLDIMGYLGVYRTARQLRNRYLRPELGNRYRILREFYAQFIRPGDLVFDVGANRGDRTEVFVQMGARVVAAEPLPALAARLRTIYRYSPVNIEAVGIGRTAGTLPLHVCSTDAVSSFSDEFVETRSKEDLGRNWDRVEMVPIVTVDALIGKYGLPAFVKIDVEGFEGEVLAGLNQAVPTLSFEVHPDDAASGSLPECLAHLDSLSHYEFNLALEESMTLELAQWVDSRCLIAAMREIPLTKWTYGDVYARRRDTRSN